MSRLIAVSDIHGCFDTLYELVINRIRLNKSDRLVLLGDYIDRGDKSKEVIDFIIGLGKQGYQVIPLCGNHESMLVEAYHNNEMLPLWFMNSGMSTLESFNTGLIEGIDDMYIDFLSNLRYYEKIGDFIFVHAGFNDLAPDPFTDLQGMIWECRTSYSNPLLEGKTIIHGHRPKTVDHVRRLLSGKSRIIPIDTGCVYEKDLGYGHLSALEVNTMELISVERI